MVMMELAPGILIKRQNHYIVYDYLVGYVCFYF